MKIFFSTKEEDNTNTNTTTPAALAREPLLDTFADALSDTFTACSRDLFSVFLFRIVYVY